MKRGILTVAFIVPWAGLLMGALAGEVTMKGVTRKCGPPTIMVVTDVDGKCHEVIAIPVWHEWDALNLNPRLTKPFSGFHFETKDGVKLP